MEFRLDKVPGNESLRHEWLQTCLKELFCKD